MARSRRRRKILAWIPAVLMVLGMVALVAGAILFQNSWWTNDDRIASTDQQTADGMSTFTTAGQDYFNVERVVFVKVGETAPRASDLGLPEEGVTEVVPPVPIEVRVLGSTGVFTLTLVDQLTFTTHDDRVTLLRLDHEGTRSYSDLTDLLRGMTSAADWTDEDFDVLADALADAPHDADGTYEATLRPSTKGGVIVTATIVLRQGVTPDMVVTFAPEA
jgi:hypothetical protein